MTPSPDTPPHHAPAPSESEKQRIWEHRQHLNDDLNNLGNYFLLAQSFLLAVAGTLGDRRLTITSVAIVAVGLSLTIISCLVLGKQRFLLGNLKSACERYFPEYQMLRAERDASSWHFSNTLILSLVVPVIFGLAWLAVGLDLFLP